MEPQIPPLPPPMPAPRSPLRRQARLAAWGLATFALAAGLPWLCYESRGLRALTDPAALRGGWLAEAAVCVGLWVLLLTTPPDAIRLSQRVGKRVILVVSAAACAAALAWLVPVLSPEPLRHRFDGKIWLLGDSPYLTSPATAAERSRGSRDPDDRPDALDAAAPHQGRTTLTLPVGQAFLAAGRATEYLLPGDAAALDARDGRDDGESWQARLARLPWWRRLFTLRLVLAAAYLLTVGELVAWLRQRGQSVWWATLFAWQPLVVIETVGMAHLGVLGALFLVAGLRRADMGRFRRGAICLAASAAVQPAALLAVPFVLRQAWQARPQTDGGGPTPAKRGGRMLLWFALTFAVLLLPLVAGGGALWSLFEAARSYAGSPPRNATVYRGLEWLFAGQNSPDRAAAVRLAGWCLATAATVAAGAVAWSRRSRAASATYAMVIAWLLLSPMSPPWALVWPLALVPVLAGRGGLTALVWAGTAALFYGGDGANDVWWQAVPVVVAAVLEVVLRRPPTPPARPAVPALP